MFVDIAPLQPLPVTLYTERVVIQGNARVRRQRLIDLLSDADEDVLTLSDVTFSQPGNGRVISSADYAQISLRTVLFAHTTEPVESNTEMKTAKRPIPAVIMCGSYMISGNIHLPMEENLLIALDEYRGRFVAVTKASYLPFESKKAPVVVDLLCVNHSLAHITVCKPEPGSEPAPQEPSQPSGW